MLVILLDHLLGWSPWPSFPRLTFITLRQAWQRHLPIVKRPSLPPLRLAWDILRPGFSRRGAWGRRDPDPLAKLLHLRVDGTWPRRPFLPTSGSAEWRAFEADPSLSTWREFVSNGEKRATTAHGSGILHGKTYDSTWAWLLIHRSVEALEMGPGSLTTGPAGMRRGALSPLPPGETAYIRALMARPGGLTPKDWDLLNVEYERLCDLAQERIIPYGERVPPRLIALRLNRELAVDATERWTSHHSRKHDTRHFRSTVAFNADPDAIVCTSS